MHVNFYITIKVIDNSIAPLTPVKTFTLTPEYNSTQLENVPTVHVGGESTPAGVSWGQNTLPILNYVVDGGNPPPAGIVIEYGTTGVLMKLYGMNGANRGNPLVSPSQNQTGLQWEIFSQEQPLGTAVNIFQIDAVTGEVTEINEGDGKGLYNLEIRVSSGDSTFQPLFIPITIGEPTATGSFSNGVITEDLYYDSAYIFNLHNNLTNAYNQIPASSPGSGNTTFEFTYPNPGGILTYDPTATLNESYGNTGCHSYNFANAGPNTLILQQPGSSLSLSEGALTSGTGFINIELTLPGDIGAAPFSIFNTSEFSWAVEYRPTPADPWNAAVDIEGNILSWNNLLASSQVNPQQSGKRLDGTANESINTATLTVNNPSVTTDQTYGSAQPTPPTASLPADNFVQINAQNRSSLSADNAGTVLLSKWVAVGNSPAYPANNTFGEYRVIIQTIGGDCDTCQGCFSLNTNKSGGPIAGKINFGDFFYNIGTERGFAYLVDTSVFANNPAGLQSALDNEMNGTTVHKLYAAEGINRYVSKFYLDPDLTTPVTNATSPGWDTASTGYISYIAADLEQSGYNTPYNAGNTSATNTKNAFAAEGASFKNANGGIVTGTTQNKRAWACQIVPTTGLKNQATSVGRVGA